MWEDAKGPFHQPLAEGQFLGHLENVQMWSERILATLDAFEASPLPKTAEKCVGAFAMVISNLEDNLRNPGDFEKSLSDKTIMKGLVATVEKIRSEVLPFLKEQKRMEAEPKDIATAQRRIHYLENALLRAEIYVASQNKHEQS
ncbi:MAG: hypothetical protein COV91_06430 [Candidatus Taylorbacteria bacterium CG11_big_fil_rev_8_21_14_0_20_46_11]|uniref:Uncharacterized protein n=1 Tax=Candidatus Taylorbacteria bacterium CG11_big_fil_rev_8_21_14_0_20_46_11 TaxID=1975025 RepID=A0A2H0K9S6_9BACT|nr:MAG: hypothetical protein COV91_06430 [Candidatus Taylorbacteria bacterium CG11_big_fil_rev_8_21_14_0_20_46_11]